MMDDLWGDVERDIASARHHFGKAIEIFLRGLGRPGEDGHYLASMAFMHAMLAGYTSFEAGIRRLFALLDEPVPSGFDWHTTLLNRIAQPAVLDTEALVVATDRLRAFRHVAMHNYDRFDEERAAIAMRAAKVFLAEIDPAMARFRAVIDPD